MQLNDAQCTRAKIVFFNFISNIFFKIFLETSACVDNFDHDEKILVATKNTMYSSIQSCAQALQYVDCSFEHLGLRIRDYCCKSCGLSK